MTPRNKELLLIHPAHAREALAMDDDMEEDAEGEILSTYDSNGVRVIEAHGVMAKGFGSYPGMVVDTAELREALLEAEEDPEVDAVVIDWDSPGGYVDGVADAADVVTNMGKPVVSFAGGMCCSAAYWIASASDSIVANQSATVGSIGVYVVHEDLSGLAGQMGAKVDVIASGKYKGAGVPGTSLTPEQRALIQERVNKLAGRFKAAVLSDREVPEMAMEGQTFDGEDAVDVGLFDDLAATVEDAIEAARDLVDGAS